MDWLEALILGLVQGLTEFLPVSSSGHLELGKVVLDIQAKENTIFAVVVHGATVFSTIVIFRKDVWALLKGLFKFRWNEETIYIAKLAFSMIPVLILGFIFDKEIKSLFTGNLVFVGSMLLVTAFLLSLTYIPVKSRRKISFLDALIIGIAQAAAVIPGISRSGATISTGLIIGNKKENIARFSFLMVLVPIIGANLKDLFSEDMATEQTVGAMPLMIGFLAAFISGLLACKWMINIVKKGKLLYFAIYCIIIGITAILVGIL